MDRRIPLYGGSVLAVVAIAAWLIRSCGRGPAVPQAAPPAAFAPAPPPAAPKKYAAPKKAGLLPPELLNLDELQANIRKYYPEAEHAAGKEGHVIMTVTVGKDGSVSGVRVETSGGADFDEAAKKAVLAMRFSPATNAGKPISVEINEAVDFQYDRK